MLAGFGLGLVVWRIGARLGVGLLGLALGLALAGWWWAALGPRVAAGLQDWLPLVLAPVESRPSIWLISACTCRLSKRAVCD